MKLNFLSKVVMGAAAALLFSSCELSDDTANQEPLVPEAAYGIIANTSPSSGDLYFFADNNQIDNSAFNFGDARGYYTFFLGERTLSVENADGTVLATKDVTLTNAQYFSAFAVNTFTNLELVTFNDSLQYPAANRVRVRFINLAPDAASVDVNSTTQNFATGLAFKSATEFTEVEGGNYSFTFTDTATGDALNTAEPIYLQSGRIYTIYTKGFVTPPAGSNETFDVDVMRNL